MSDRKKILLIDDEKDILEVLKDYLCDEFDVYLASCDNEAIEHLEKNSFSLVLCDYNLPGMNGEQICDYIKQKHPGTPVVFVTGDGGVSSGLSPENKSVQILYKPIDFDLLYEICTSFSRRTS